MALFITIPSDTVEMCIIFSPPRCQNKSPHDIRISVLSHPVPHLTKLTRPGLAQSTTIAFRNHGTAVGWQTEITSDGIWICILLGDEVTQPYRREKKSDKGHLQLCNNETLGLYFPWEEKNTFIDSKNTLYSGFPLHNWNKNVQNDIS